MKQRRTAKAAIRLRPSAWVGLFRIPLSLTLTVLALSACFGGDEPQRAERCVWRIGTISSDSAEPGFEGRPILEGIRFGIATANRDFDLDCRFELVERSASASEEIEAAARELAGAERLVAVVGPYSSQAAKAVSDVFAEADLPWLTPSAARADLTLPDTSRFFRLISPDADEGEAAGRFLTEVAGAQRVAVINEQSGYARAVAEAAIESLGSAVVDSDEFEDPSELADGVAQAAKTDPDAILFSGTGANFAQLIGHAERSGLDVLFAAPSTGKDPGLAALSEARGAIVFCSCADPGASADSELRSWAAAFAKDGAGPPGPFALEAYEGVQIVAQALKASGFTRESAIGEIHDGVVAWAHTNSYRGLAKIYAFDAEGELQAPAVYAYEVSSSGFREVGLVGELID